MVLQKWGRQLCTTHYKCSAVDELSWNSDFPKSSKFGPKSDLILPKIGPNSDLRLVYAFKTGRQACRNARSSPKNEIKRRVPLYKNLKSDLDPFFGPKSDHLRYRSKFRPKSDFSDLSTALHLDKRCLIIDVASSTFLHNTNFLIWWV